MSTSPGDYENFPPSSRLRQVLNPERESPYATAKAVENFCDASGVSPIAVLRGFVIQQEGWTFFTLSHDFRSYLVEVTENLSRISDRGTAVSLVKEFEITNKVMFFTRCWQIYTACRLEPSDKETYIKELYREAQRHGIDVTLDQLVSVINKARKETQEGEKTSSVDLQFIKEIVRECNIEFDEREKNQERRYQTAELERERGIIETDEVTNAPFRVTESESEEKQSREKEEVAQDGLAPQNSEKTTHGSSFVSLSRQHTHILSDSKLEALFEDRAKKVAIQLCESNRPPGEQSVAEQELNIIYGELLNRDVNLLTSSHG